MIGLYVVCVIQGQGKEGDSVFFNFLQTPFAL